MTSETALRQIRARIFAYPDHKQQQADRVLSYLKSRVMRARKPACLPVGKYSGLTPAELRASRTCETDWY